MAFPTKFRDPFAASGVDPFAQGFRDPFAQGQSQPPDYGQQLQTDIANLTARLQSQGQYEPPKPRHNLLDALLKALNVPGSAVRGAILEARAPEQFNFLDALWKNQQSASGQALLKELGALPENKIGKFVAGLGVDIATDPLTYLAGGITRPLSFFGKSLTTEGAVQPFLRGAEAGLRQTGELGATLGSEGVLAARRAAANASRESAVAAPVISRDTLENIARERGYNSAAELRQVVRSAEQAGAVDSLGLPQNIVDALKIGTEAPVTTAARPVAEALQTGITQNAPRALTRQETAGLQFGGALRENAATRGFFQAIMPTMLQDPQFAQMVRMLRIGTSHEADAALKNLEQYAKNLAPEQQRQVTDLVESTLLRARTVGPDGKLLENIPAIKRAAPSVAPTPLVDEYVNLYRSLSGMPTDQLSPVFERLNQLRADPGFAGEVAAHNAAFDAEKMAATGMPGAQDLGRATDPMGMLFTPEEAASLKKATPLAAAPETLSAVRQRYPQMGRLLEDAPIETLPPPVFDAFQNVTSTLAEYGDKRLQRGLLSSLLDNYFPHKLPPEEGKGFGLGKLTTTQASAKYREFRQPIAVLEQMAAKGQAVPKFEHEFVRPFAKEVIDSINNIHTFDFFHETAAQFGIRAEDMASRLGMTASMAPKLPEEVAGMKLVDFGTFLVRGNKNSTFGKLGKVYLPNDIADELTRLHTAYNTDEGIRAFAQLWDKTTGLWRPLVTVLRLAYHFNNALGNTWNSFLGGLTNPDRYVSAAKVLSGAEGAVRIGTEEVPYKLLKDIAEKSGAIDSGIFATELRPDALARIQQKLGVGGHVSELWGKLVAGGASLGRIVESESRMALFLDQLIKRGSAGEDAVNAAVQHVNKYLFDYRSGLSKFEREVMRRVAPFYSFTRFNIPLQVAELVNQPGKFLLYKKTKDNLAQLEAPPDAVPPWLEDALRIPVKMPDGRTLFFNPRLPLQQLTMLPGGGESASGELLGMLHPLPKMILELATGQNFFTGRPIQQYQGQTIPATGILSPISAVAPGLVGSDVPGRVSPYAAYLSNQFGAVSQVGTAFASATAADAPPEDILRAVRLAIPGLYSYDPTQQEIQNLAAERQRLQDQIRKNRDEGTPIPTIADIRRRGGF